MKATRSQGNGAVALDLAAPREVSDRKIAALLFLGFVLLRLPFRAESLVNWDAVNFALGVVDGFDLAHHQPHPPGYIGYVVVGRVFSWIAGDANGGFTLISVIAGAIAPACLFVLARRFVDRRCALMGALMFGTAPLVWYYSVVALTYIVAVAIIIPLAWTCHVARVEGSSRHLLGGGVLLALLGAFRQTDMLLLAPLWLYAAASVAPRDRRRAFGVTSALTLVWLVPLLWLAGGPFTYLQASLDLARHSGGKTWIFSLSPTGLLSNARYVALGVSLGLFLAVVPLARWARRRTVLPALSPTDRRFFVLWAVPALAVFLLLHTGQVGYVLVVLPIGYLVLVLVLACKQADLPRVTTTRATMGAITVSTVAFLLLPHAAGMVLDQWTGTPLGATVPPAVEGEQERERVIHGARPYDLRRNDAFWNDTVSLVDELDTERSAVVALAETGGSFRQLTYYAPEHTVFGVGHDRIYDRFGYLFRAHDQGSNYRIGSQMRAKGELVLPSVVDHLAIVDPALQAVVDPAVASRGYTEVEGSASILHIDVVPGSRLVFTGDEEDEGEIRLVTPAPPGTQFAR